MLCKLGISVASSLLNVGRDSEEARLKKCSGFDDEGHRHELVLEHVVA